MPPNDTRKVIDNLSEYYLRQCYFYINYHKRKPAICPLNSRWHDCYILWPFPGHRGPWLESDLVSVKTTIGVGTLNNPAAILLHSLPPRPDGGACGAEEGDLVPVWLHIGVPPDILIACHGRDKRRGPVE